MLENLEFKTYGFVYLWYDKRYKKYYIGSHWGYENDGYVCSSKYMLKEYKERQSDFKRRILEVTRENRKTLYNKENYWLGLAKTKNKKHYYNRSFRADGIDYTVNGTEEYRKIISDIISDKWKDENYRKHMSEVHKGKKLSAASREKLSKSITGRKMGPLSPEHKEKLKIAHTGIKLTKDKRVNYGKGFRVLFKNGQEKIIYNLKIFAEENDYSYQSLKIITRTKGTNKDIQRIDAINNNISDKVKNNTKAARTYIIYYTNGSNEIIYNLAKFCREKGYSYGNMMVGMKKGHRMYDISRIEKLI